MVGSRVFLLAGQGTEKARQDKGLAVFTTCETRCTCGCPACAGRIPADFGAKVAKNALLFAKTPEEGRALVEFFAVPKVCARAGFGTNMQAAR